MTATERAELLRRLEDYDLRLHSLEAALEGEGDVIAIADRDYLDIHQGDALFRVFYASEEVGATSAPGFTRQHWAYWWRVETPEDAYPDVVEGQTGTYPSQLDAAVAAVQAIFASLTRG